MMPYCGWRRDWSAENALLWSELMDEFGAAAADCWVVVVVDSHPWLLLLKEVAAAGVHWAVMV